MDGRVFNIKTGRERKLQQKKNGYLTVLLWNNNESKRVNVHRLVALAYIPNPDNKPTVDHINWDRADNRVENLRWATRKEQGNNRSGKDIRSKPVLCVETGIIYPSARECGRQTGFTQANISGCCNGKQKTANGYHWRYV